MTHSELFAAMSRPDFYPHRPLQVEVIQTHISFVFIAGNEVYKVKKAVDFGFLDFTTVEKRKFYCEEELRLNRRLAPDTYLGIVPITEDAAGVLSLDGKGRIIDYAVRMKRLPEELMLGRILSEKRADASTMEAIARKLADFHRKAETGGRIDAIGGVETIRLNHEENFAATAQHIGVTIPESRFAFIRAYARDFLKRQEPLLRRRVTERKIRDCHGDLHLDHICVANGITIIDCIEFNDRLRIGDVATDVAFLAMDLDYNGYSRWADVFVEAYIRSSADPDVGKLLNFYRCYYAYVRGKVAGFQMGDRALGRKEQEASRETAARYFDLAYTYAARLERPALVLMAGLTGTGKSVLARNLAPRLGAELIRSDVLRKELLGIPPTERHPAAFGEGIYSSDYSRQTYGRARELAVGKLGEGRTVIIDASYRRRAERLRAAEAAKNKNIDFFVIECVCPEKIVRERLDARRHDATEPSDGRWEIYRAQKTDFEALDEVSAPSHIIIDTTQDPDASLDTVIRRIKGLTAAERPL